MTGLRKPSAREVVDPLEKTVAGEHAAWNRYAEPKMAPFFPKLTPSNALYFGHSGRVYLFLTRRTRKPATVSSGSRTKRTSDPAPGRCVQYVPYFSDATLCDASRSFTRPM